MKTLSILGMAVATLSFPLSAFATAAHSQQYATEWSDKPHGATYYTKNGTKIHITSGPGIDAKMKEVEAMLRGEKIAQYAPPSQVNYYPPSFFQGSSGPVVVPPTVINTQPNKCRQKRINILLFFDVESSDC